MAMSPNRFAIAAILSLSLATAGGAWAQAPGDRAVTGIFTSSSFKTEAKVTAVDPGTRMVTVLTADGRTLTHKASDAVQNLGQVKVGDIALISYEERTSYILSEPGARLPAAGDLTVSAAGTKGQRPAGGIMRQGLANYTVVGTNVAGNTITLVDAAGGEVRTFDVTDPTARSQLPRVKAGDALTAIDRQTLIATIVRKPS
ncbi:MAG TPA: hypothetical protein VHP59_14465 [Vineibacter terrae]|nr:hypothetical protein [Vineibacter terrae]